ncbi:legume-specific protein [Senna tora]|uniref:Legume-specific protein n=1 Tax=Senna tora TaxID=362788 RepID=A0A835CJG5_9FABA|nr:legume-specific protein [Senna tora]
MEGLIPFVYRAIMQYKNGKEGAIGSWFCESPSYSYVRLPGDSGRFQASASALLSDYGFSAASSSAKSSSSATQYVVSSPVQSQRSHMNHQLWGKLNALQNFRCTIHDYEPIKVSVKVAFGTL